MNIKSLITEEEYKKTLKLAKLIMHEKGYAQYYLFKKIVYAAAYANGKGGFISYDDFLYYAKLRITKYDFKVYNLYDLKYRAFNGDSLFGIKAKVLLFGTEKEVEDEIINNWIGNK